MASLGYNGLKTTSRKRPTCFDRPPKSHKHVHPLFTGRFHWSGRCGPEAHPGLQGLRDASVEDPDRGWGDSGLGYAVGKGQARNCPLRWRHNGHDNVSNYQPHDCLLNRLFRRRSQKTSKLRITGLCAGNSPGTGEFPSQMASNAENVSVWWRHHAKWQCDWRLYRIAGMYNVIDINYPDMNIKYINFADRIKKILTSEVPLDWLYYIIS